MELIFAFIAANLGLFGFIASITLSAIMLLNADKIGEWIERAYPKYVDWLIEEDKPLWKK